MERYQDAIEEFQEALTMNPENLEAMAFMGEAMAELGNRKGALNALKKVKAAESRTEPALLVAAIYSSLGDDTEMFRSLDRALQNKCIPLYIFLLQPTFRRYEKDSRYNSFLRSMGVPQFAKA
jgi:tetratricopeptide (TPR) repeat protein